MNQEPETKEKSESTAVMERIKSEVVNHPVAVVAKALSKLNDDELAELGASITPNIVALYEKAFGPAILHVLAPITMGQSDEKNQQQDGQSPTQTLSTEETSALEQEVRNLMRDPRYWRDHQPEYMAKVARAFDKLYG